MTSDITAQIINGENEGTTYTYSVKEYADYLLEHANENGSDEEKAYAKAVPLVKAMLNYGAYSQIVFNSHTDRPANAGLTDNEKKLENVSVNIADPVFEGLPEGTIFEGATLSLKSETTLSLYFRSSTPLEFSCEGQIVEKEVSDEYYAARIRSISAKNIGNTFDLKVNSGTVKFSPLNYCKFIIASTASAPDEQLDKQKLDLLNVVRALYLYWQKADAYFT